MGSIKKESEADKKRRIEGLSMQLLSSWSLKNKTHDWREHARCLGVKDIFFSVRGRNQETMKIAKKICAFCPVRRECLSYAQDNMLAYGIWGGKTATERLRLLGLRRWPTNDSDNSSY
jgi:hypothetical protein